MSIINLHSYYDSTIYEFLFLFNNMPDLRFSYRHDIYYARKNYDNDGVGEYRQTEIMMKNFINEFSKISSI